MHQYRTPVKLTASVPQANEHAPSSSTALNLRINEKHLKAKHNNLEITIETPLKTQLLMNELKFHSNHLLTTFKTFSG